MPSSTQRIAVIRYGASTRLTRKPGALFTGSGSLSIARTNAAPRASSDGSLSWPATTSTSIILATGLKKCRPMSRDGSASAEAMSSSGIDDVFVARIASGFARASTSANSARFAATSSKIASTITSACAMPSPGTSGISRSSASRVRRGSFRRSVKSFAARFIAGPSRCTSWSCSVTIIPRNAHQAAMSPPIVPPPTTCTRVTPDASTLPSDFSRSCRWNTRIRFAVVGVASSAVIDAGSPGGGASGSPSKRSKSSRIAYGAG